MDEQTIEIPVPVVAPTGFEMTAEGVQQVWDTFVVPTQSDDAAPQSIEDRMLAAILRAVYAGMEPEKSGWKKEQEL